MVLKTDFQRSDVNSQDPLNDNFQQLAPLIEDTGWVNIELVNGGTAGGGAPQYRVKNGQVFFRGGFGASAQVGVDDAVAPGRIPANLAPSTVRRFPVAQGTTASGEFATININTTGYIQIAARSNNTKVTFLDTVDYLLD